ncbi:PAAR domain-containing protein [Burkholderia pseudomallei]|uniref:PAAR domain-containing protein n=1 Tax=Burkholderia pseudomallei TaxID=28450 RepID=UPI000F063B09|nr:PAAR domain-containing protein [Burkholderia pseudomallei]VBS83999.1 PAAR motif-containing protein [Burkholderia pseudomallei]
MVKRAIICVGDTTTHGGKVLEGAPTFTLNGRNVAGVGHQVLCPRCKGVFPILPDLLGRRYPHTIGERDTAVEGPRDKISFHSTTRGPSGTRPLKRPPDSTTDTLLDAGAGYARAHGEKYGWSLEMGQHQA